MLALLLTAHLLDAPTQVDEGVSREKASATVKPSIPVRLVNKGLLPVTVVIEGNPIRVGPFSHAYVGFPAGAEVRRHSSRGAGRLIHIIRAKDRNRDIGVN